MTVRNTSQTTLLLELAEALDLWITPDGETYATVLIENHVDNLPVRSSGFRNMLAARFFDAEGTAASRDSINGALDVIEAHAARGGRVRTAPVRVARDEGDAFLYLDLADPERHVVEVTMSGWRVIDSHECPVRFRRAPIVSALPVPERGGDLRELHEFVNVSTDDDFVLMTAWLLGALRGSGPYPILALHGEQGSGKTGTARILRSIVDPSALSVRAEPRDARDLMVATRGAHVLAFDNLSRVQPWLSDALCRLSTGGGYATRSLYSNGEEAVFDAVRPVVLTGIEDLAERGDLMERSIAVCLPRIPDHRRRTEAGLREAFGLAQPRILGALLDAVVEGLGGERQARLSRLPRMADFALWVVSAEPRLPWPSGAFLAAYQGNLFAANETALEASPVAFAVLRLMEGCECWQGPASELLAKLGAFASQNARDGRTWPRSPKSLSGMLRRLAPNLRAAGIEVEFGQTAGAGSRRFVRLTPIERSDTCVASVASDALSAPRCDEGDARDAHAREPEGGAAIEELF